MRRYFTNERLKIFIVFTTIVIILLLLSGFKRRDSDYFFKISKSIDIYGQVYKEITLNYVDELDPEKFMRAGVDGLLDGLDPYTNFFDEEEGGEIELITSGKYGGIGVTIGMRDDRLTVISLMDGYAAQRQGIQPGDRISEIDGKKVGDMKPDEVRTLTRGEPGTIVRLTVEREDEKDPLTFELVRQEIQLKNVTFADYIDSGLGYIKLEHFSRTAGDEVRLAIKDLKTKGDLKGLILDLRDNPGGLLESAIDIVEKFVPKGSVIVTTRGRKAESEKIYTAKEEPVLPDVPLVVMVNHNSASASEIVAGALQDLDRAVIVGSRSFGKGLVQTVVPLAYGAQLKMTTAKYYTPSGRCIQEIDYKNKDKSGMFSITPDSLRKEFKTTAGRSVYEGGGIMPDSVIEDSSMTVLMKELLRRSMFFRFATRYASIHKDSTLSPAGSLLKEFNTYLDSIKFVYQDDAEKKLGELTVVASAGKYSPEVNDEIAKLKKTFQNEKQYSVQRDSTEILRQLRKEIMSRYKGEYGRISASLINDKQIEVAKVLAMSNESLHRILSMQTK